MKVKCVGDQERVILADEEGKCGVSRTHEL